MRYFSAGVLSSLIAGGFFGCAHAQRFDSPLTSETVTSYRAVRSGEEQIRDADGVEFCAGEGEVQVVSTRSRSTDDWADKFRDRDVQREVRDLIGRDPTLSGQPVSIRVHQGEAIISGSVERDADAVAAARDALAVPGVVAVALQTTSRESPAQPHLVATLCQ